MDYDKTTDIKLVGQGPNFIQKTCTVSWIKNQLLEDSIFEKAGILIILNYLNAAVITSMPYFARLIQFMVSQY